jgi:hypothetical protein
MILTSWLGRVAPEYKLAAEACVCAVLVGVGYWLHGIWDDHKRVASYESYIETQQKRDAQYVVDSKSVQDLLNKSSTTLEGIREQGADLRTAINGKTSFTIKVPNAQNPNCPDVRLNDVARLCFNAAVSGDPATIAACKAGGSITAVPAAH